MRQKRRNSWRFSFCNRSFTDTPYFKEVIKMFQINKNQQDVMVCYYVAECMEFPTLGEYYDNLSLEDAIRLYQTIPSHRINGIKGIGFDLKDGSDYEGTFPILTGNVIDLQTIQEIAYFRDNPHVQKAVQDLVAAMPGMTIIPAYELENGSSRIGHEKMTAQQTHQQEQEKDFFSYPGDCYAIYQIREEDPQRMCFMNMKYITNHGLSVVRSYYDLIYISAFTYNGDIVSGLESLYEQFNLYFPADYRGRSMSVSDVVAVKIENVVSCYFVDSVGFQQIYGFLPDNKVLDKSQKKSVLHQLRGYSDDIKKKTISMPQKNIEKEL